MSSPTEAHLHRAASADWLIDLCCILFLIVSSAVGSITAYRNVQEYRAQKAALAIFREQPPMLEAALAAFTQNEPPSIQVEYLRADYSQYMYEFTGCVVVLAITCLFRNRLTASLSAERRLPKIVLRDSRVINLKPMADHKAPVRVKPESGIAQRMEDVLWADRAARHEARFTRDGAGDKVA